MLINHIYLIHHKLKMIKLLILIVINYMIYIYGSGGRAKLIKELLIRLGNNKKEIMFVDDKKRKFKGSSYLINRFNKKKDKLFIGITEPKLQVKKYLYFKKKLKKIDNKALIDPRAVLKSKNKIGKNVI